MILHYKIVTAALGLGVAACIGMLVRRDKMRAGYSLWWLSIALALGILGAFPELFDVIGRSLGVAYPPVLALIFGYCMLLVKILYDDLGRSRMERDLRKLAQRLAVYEQMKEGKNGK